MILYVHWCTVTLWEAFFQLRRVVVMLFPCYAWVPQLLISIFHVRCQSIDTTIYSFLENKTDLEHWARWNNEGSDDNGVVLVGYWASNLFLPLLLVVIFDLFLIKISLLMDFCTMIIFNKRREEKKMSYVSTSHELEMNYLMPKSQEH